MKQFLSIGQEPNLQRLVIASAVLHLFFLTILFIPFKTKEREFKSYYVNLVGPVEVRSEGKTRITRRAKKKVATKKRSAVKKKRIAKKPEAAEQKSVSTKPKSDSEMSSKSRDIVAKEIERLRAIKALSARRNERERTREIEVIRKRLYEYSSGGVGVPGRGEQLSSNSYYAIITQKIWSEWVYPDLESTGLEMIVSIRIDRDGNVVSHKVEKSSGNILFDRSAINAISKASPLPPPPMEMEIGVRFYL